MNKYRGCDIESYLDALKKLYALLIIFGDDRQSVQNHISPDTVLNENARFLLKDLLDGAAEKVLKTASEESEGHDFNSLNIERVNVEASYILNSISHLKSRAMQFFYKFVKFIYQVIVSIMGLSNKHSLTEQQQSQNSLKMASSFTGLKNTNLIADKQISKDKQGQSVDSEQSEASIYVTELWNRKKRCQICRKSSAKQVKFERATSSAMEIEDTGKETTIQLKDQVDAHEKAIKSCNEAILANFSNDNKMQERISGFQFRPRGNGASVHFYNSDASGIVTSGALENLFTDTEKSHKDIYCISKEASDAIKNIESCISALKVGGKLVDSGGKQTEPGQGGVFKFASGSVPGLGSLNMGDTAALVSPGDQNQVGHFMLGRNDSHCHLVRRRAWETKGLTRWRHLSRSVVNPRWRQLSRSVLNPLNELNLPNQSMRNYASLSPWNANSRKSLFQNFGKDNEITLRGNTFNQVEELTERQKLGLHKASLVHVKNVKTNVGKVESITQNKKSPRRTNSVQGLKIPLNSDKKNSLLDKLPRKTNNLILDGNLQKSKFGVVGQTKPSVPAVNQHIKTRSKTSATSKILPHQKIIRQTQRDLVMHGDQLENDREVERINQKGKQRLIFPDQRKSNSRTPPGSSSSSWTTQQGSTSYHDSEKYLVTDHSQSSHHSATSASSESEGNYVCSSTQGHGTGSTSYSDSQFSSVPSSSQSLEDSDSSGEVVGHLHSDQSSSLRSSDPSYQQEHCSRRYRPTIRRRPKKRTGRLKKLKDKVAIIFHHHHHHHHYSDDSKHSDDQLRADQKMFKRRDQAQTSGEKATEKLSKSMVHYTPNRKRGTNLNRLVNGLVRHVRHSKKSKKSKGGTEHQAKHQHVSKKLARKVHWWQRGRPPRMKMLKKPRIKFGSGTKRSKLKALPTIKWH